MADEKNNELEINLKSMGLGDDENNTDLDAFLSADQENASPLLQDDDDVGEIADEEIIDFNDFSIDDLDTALSKYGDSEGSTDFLEKVQPDSSSVKHPVQTTAEMAVTSAPASAEVVDDLVDNDVTEEETFTVSEIVPEATEAVPEGVTIVPEATEVVPEAVKSAQTGEKPVNFAKTAEMSSVSETKSFGEYSLFDEDDKIFKNLIWYDGTLGEKVYEISLMNMPEFLDYDKNIRTIHVNIDSSYGWNVFFENGVFMNLLDLKEYQERNGKMPGTNGKIIYGNKTTTFEKIEKIVVYEKPRYFSYAVQK